MHILHVPMQLSHLKWMVRNEVTYMTRKLVANSSGMTPHNAPYGVQPRTKTITRRELGKEALMTSIGAGALLGSSCGSCGICAECSKRTRTYENGCGCERTEKYYKVRGPWSKAIGVGGASRGEVILAWLWGGIVGGLAGGIVGAIGAAMFGGREIHETVPALLEAESIVRGLDDPRRRWIFNAPKEILATRYDSGANEMRVYLTNGIRIVLDATTGVEKRTKRHRLVPPTLQETNNLAIGNWQWVTSAGSLTAYENRQEQWHLRLTADTGTTALNDSRTIEGAQHLYAQPPIYSVEVFHLGTFLAIVRSGDPTVLFHDPTTGAEIATYKRPEHTNTIPLRLVRMSHDSLSLSFQDGYVVIFTWDQNQGGIPRPWREIELGSEWQGAWSAGFGSTLQFIACHHSIVAFKKD